MQRDHSSSAVIHPYLIGDDLVGTESSSPTRWVIDINHAKDVIAAKRHEAAFERIAALVKPEILKNAHEEKEKTKKDKGPRQSHAKRWWQHWRGRQELLGKLKNLERYIVCSRVTRRPIFEFVSGLIWPGDALTAFPLDDDYSFGILSSTTHWTWFQERCSTLKGDWRYTSDTVFDSFAWPQEPTAKQVQAIADRGVDLRKLRSKLVKTMHPRNLRTLYGTLKIEGNNQLRDAIENLDAAVRTAYGMNSKEDAIAFLLALNEELADAEAEGRSFTGPGIPKYVTHRGGLVTHDRVEAPEA